MKDDDTVSLAIQRAVDAALGEVVRQCGAIGSQIALEARGCGLDAGRFVMEHATYRVWVVVTHGHIIHGIWTSEGEARRYAATIYNHPDIAPELFEARTNTVLR